MVTTRRRAFPLPQMNTNRVGKLQTVAAVLTESDIPTKIGSFETVDREITLTDARILVSSGRSVDLGDTMRRHMGQISKTLQPDFYITCGISAAIQSYSNENIASDCCD